MIAADENFWQDGYVPINLMTESTSIIPNGRPALESKIRELKKIESELLEKHRDELKGAGWWKAFLIRLRISREANRIFRHRIYSSSGNTPPESD